MLSYNPTRDRIHNTHSVVVPIPYWYNKDKREWWIIRNDELPARRNARRKYLYLPLTIMTIAILFSLLW